MEIALPRQDAPADVDPRLLDSPEGPAGTSPGINISPGSDDDGWIVPPPVKFADGSLVQLYKDGEALHAAYDAIKSAKRRICLEVYIFASDDTGRAFAELLAAKAQEGVFVYVIYDSVGCLHSDRRMFEDMRRAGVRLAEFHPIRPWESQYSWRPINRDHRKLLVVDDELGGLGGLNVGREYAGSWVIESKHQDDSELWRDNAIGIRGPAVRQLTRSFARTWKYIASGGPIRRTEFSYELEDGSIGLLASVPTVDSPLRPFLCNLLSDARKTIDMTMAYFAPDDELVSELIRAARRGVHVRLMLPSRSDIKLLIIAAHSFYERLMDAGIEIYERQAVVLHAKTMCIDDRVSLIGSANLDHRSVEFNLEISAIIRNEQFGQQMRTLFENDMRYAKRIDPAAWRRRPMWDRFWQWAVFRARYLL
jgi:cardiolipin synthase A/B